MFFRNLTFFRFPSTFAGLFPTPVADALDGMETALAERPLKPVGPLELSSRGFVSPFGHGADALVHRVEHTALVTIGGEDKLLPPSVVHAELQKRIEVIEEREGRSPGGRARKRLKEDVVQELLPKAFVQPMRCDAYFDFDRHFIAIDTGSRKSAESFVSEIRHAVGSFPALPLNAEVSPRAVLTQWLATDDRLPDGLTLGEECELRELSSDGARVRCVNIDLRGDDVNTHLEAGMQCTRLALIYDGRLSFVFGEDLVVRKLRFLEGALDDLNKDLPDQRAEQDARFFLMGKELGKLFDTLASAFRLSSADEPDAEPPAKKKARKGKALDGVDSVTLTIPGRAPVTVSADFAVAANYVARMVEIVQWVRDNETGSISALQRYLKCGYNDAARIAVALEEVGVLSAPDENGKRTVLPA